MVRSATTHIGDGKPAIVLKEIQRRWPGLEVTFRSDDITRPTDWRIHDRRHAVVVHLGGTMRRLETELDGFGGSTGPALPGEVWTAPAERKYVSHACGEHIHYAVMFLDPAAQDRICGSTVGRRKLAPLAGARDEFLHHTVRELKQSAEASDDVSQMLAEALSQTVALHLCRKYMDRNALPAKATGCPRLNTEATRQLREYIYDNLCECITLVELSRLAGLTTHQLLVAFREAFGTTPAQYVIQQRLRCAQRQLASTKKDITSIALDSGFSSHSHLTACFQKHLGRCPTEYRTQARCLPNLSS
jgi:AraC family transcriptional regulator